MSDDAKRQQVADQCKVVAHLAEALAKVHRDYEMMLRSGAIGSILDTVGHRTAFIMDSLGDILNGMDALNGDDLWTHSVFERREEFGFVDHQTRPGTAT